MADVNKGGQQGSGLQSNVASCLCYVCCAFSGLVFLLIEKNDPEVKFNAWQSVFLTLACIAYSFATFILGFIPFLAIIIGFINIVVGLGMLAVVVACAIKAYQGQRLSIPVISDLAQKQVK